jgi:CO dehydrogenase/acetyl-CoA synthase alpha subunit
MPAMRGRLLTSCLLAGLALGACGGDDKQASKDCLSSQAALEAAARAHVDKIVIGTKEVGDADKIAVDTCRTSDTEATATVTVEGIRDDSVQDQRHQLTLEKKSGRWTITRDLDSQRCRKNRGHQDFSSIQCK